ncbi:MAG: VCBS repeat-containing protein [Planctomycetota bacterium]|nr:VCBS repeat-containing protein [Planctomycetota bacterium]
MSTSPPLETETVSAPETEPEELQPAAREAIAKPSPETTAKKPHRWRKRLAYGSVAFLFLAAGVGIYAKFAFDRIEERAVQLSEAGVSLNKFLKSYVGALRTRDVDGLLSHYTDDYTAENEGLWTEVLESERDGAKVYAWQTADPRTFSKSDLRGQHEDHLTRVSEIDQAKFKIASIEDFNHDAGTIRIRSVLWIRGSNEQKESVESRTWFRLSLKRGDEKSWKIASKELLYGQTVKGPRKGFTDITEESGITFKSQHNPLLREAEWRPDKFAIMKYAAGGITTADYDNDGWVDLLFIDGGSTQLFRNLGNGKFADTTSTSGLPTDLKGGSVALFVDLDNDDDKDLFIGRGTGNNLLFKNNADGTFTDVTETANVNGIWVSTAAAADYNNDGYVDIYFGRYLDPRINLPTTNFYTRNSEGNTLLKNNGDLTFTDVTKESGVREGGLTLGIAWADYDEDGDQDIYVANDFGRNALLRNEGDGTFSDVSKESGTSNIGYGMSSSFADIDNDGDLDIYVAAVHSGQRWFGNSATIHRYLVTSFREGTLWEDYPTYLELYDLLGGNWEALGEEVLKGNTLMLNNGDGTFSDVTEQARVNPHGWYWSSAMFDFDNDGLQDIYTVNGWITGKEPDDL